MPATSLFIELKRIYNLEQDRTVFRIPLRYVDKDLKISTLE